MYTALPYYRYSLPNRRKQEECSMFHQRQSLLNTNVLLNNAQQQSIKV